MQYVYEDLGITIVPGPGPDTAEDIVSFTVPETDEPVAIANSLYHQPAGIRACGCSLGIKADGKPDFAVITVPQPGHAAAVFSQSRCPGYAVLRNRAVMADSTLQAIAVNSGNANVFTPNGMQELTRIAQLLAEEFGLDADRVLICQTGAIGVPLPMEAFEAGIPQLSTTLRGHNLDAASEAILTTDIGPKVASVALGEMVLAGIAKGAGDSDVAVDHTQRLAKNICNSPLVKTAIHGGKSGWGRIIAAIGKPQAGYADPILAPDHVEISLQGQPVYRRGQVVSPDTRALHAALHTEKIIHVHVIIGTGGCLARVWGCDLSPEYVQINA